MDQPQPPHGGVTATRAGRVIGRVLLVMVGAVVVLCVVISVGTGLARISDVRALDHGVCSLGRTDCVEAVTGVLGGPRHRGSYHNPQPDEWALVVPAGSFFFERDDTRLNALTGRQVVGLVHDHRLVALRTPSGELRSARVGANGIALSVVDLLLGCCALAIVVALLFRRGADTGLRAFIAFVVLLVAQLLLRLDLSLWGTAGIIAAGCAYAALAAAFGPSLRRSVGGAADRLVRRGASVPEGGRHLRAGLRLRRPGRR